MLLAIDIGNSQIKFGVFDGDDLLDRSTLPTKPDHDLQFDRFTPLNIDKVIVATVAPDLTDQVRSASQKHFQIAPTFVDHSTVFGLKINYDPVESVGIDRLINAFAAVNKYGSPVIVCSFGTATVIDAVSKDCEFLGGIVTPGVQTMAESLNNATSKLPAVEIRAPERLIGNSTESAILSGIVNGHIAMAEGLIKKVSSEFRVSSFETNANSDPGTRNSELNVVATGGFAALIASKIEAVTQIDETLTLDGLRILAQRI